jgi:hypothetical protein
VRALRPDAGAVAPFQENLMNAREPRGNPGLRCIAMVGAAIALMMLLATVAAWLAWVSWRPAGARDGPGATQDFGITGPRLENAPSSLTHMGDPGAGGQRRLRNWVRDDREAGIARIPVQDAIRILAVRRAPTSAGERP